jgi:hypothetical protein
MVANAHITLEIFCAWPVHINKRHELFVCMCTHVCVERERVAGILSMAGTRAQGHECA